MRNDLGTRAEQIMSALLQYGSGMPIYTVMLKHNITEETLFAWQRLYQNMNLEQIERVCLLEAENVALQSLVDLLITENDGQIDEGILVPPMHAVLSA
jgi:Transposase